MGYKLYIDGSCKGNGKISSNGGAAVVITDGTKIIDLLCEKSPRATTNSEQEVKALLMALNYIKNKGINDEIVEIYCDNQYAVKGYNEWINNWVKSNWINKAKKIVAQVDYWKVIWELKKELKNIKVSWVKGHNGNEMNEVADAVAKGWL